MRTNTREKLLEAKYFLEHMKVNQSNRDAFKYNLSAFLAASRSVTLIMQKEFSKLPCFQEWYKKKQFDETMKLLNDKRVKTIHHEPVRPQAHVAISVMDYIGFSDSVSIKITHANGTVERSESKPTLPPTPTTKTETKVEWLWYFDELPNNDIITVCEEHIIKLETIVSECESLFS